MFNKYYEQELQNLKHAAVEFAKAHPATAPMLSGPTADPDAERLLEGVAFLCGLLHQKLHDDFPEIIHSLMEVTFPHYIRPIPATSIVVFTPKPNLPETIHVKKGISLASVPVDGTPCLFQTCFDIDVHPLHLASAELIQSSGQPQRIRLALELTGPDLSRWAPVRLGFFLGGSHTQATDLFAILNHYLRKITLRPTTGGRDCELAPSDLKPIGFDTERALLSYPGHSFSGYRLLQEFFILPRKFTFFELRGWEKWQDRGNGKQFEIIFELAPFPIAPPKVTRDLFILNATPVINLFKHEADPFLFDHRLEKVRIRPVSQNPEHYQIFSVDKVTGYEQGSVAKKEYRPLTLFPDTDRRQSVYQVNYARSHISNAPETYLSFSYPADGTDPVNETLSVSLTCTNGTLPERLQLGDISVPTSESPELLTFRNVLPPTAPIDPPLGENAAWRFLSHLSLNYLSLANLENLRELLRLYVLPEARDKAMIAANVKRIEGIMDFRVTPADRLFRGMVLRGQEIEMTARQDHFAGFGDLYLFGCILDLFFGVYSSINTIISFKLKETLTGETFIWPTRMGDRPLS
ncbi:MAG TPA: type VI secretion system baseplate subunit TssF [Syntrophales bacterium]|jgi:type VI secretion system protein ImpG|nr:type VI secretion system baseplate subunit TssF [Syntrophales bacterium]HON22241.1 type VI secretion system baseplate subunit TssF [Syntrophales bacterium]HOU77267.1 type VI secretion system baseplate subunit TssF [Syntrophales bacterium]HPC32698.1 type VI secretion system baseplate subunit TssF [Syntrophales bacterium]HQG34241.1 type VI secretion system baseplate subunit TssF [Syntrophales bacterium]